MHLQSVAGARLHLAVAVEVGEGRVHVVVGLATEEFERKALRVFAPTRFGWREKAWEGIEACRGQRIGVKLDLARRRGNRAGGIRLEGLRLRVPMEAEREVSLLCEVLKRDVLHAGIG